MWESKNIELTEVSQIISKLEVMAKLKTFPTDIRYVFTIKDINIIYMLPPLELLALIQQIPDIEFTSFSICQMIK